MKKLVLASVISIFSLNSYAFTPSGQAVQMEAKGSIEAGCGFSGTNLLDIGIQPDETTGKLGDFTIKTNSNTHDPQVSIDGFTALGGENSESVDINWNIYQDNYDAVGEAVQINVDSNAPLTLLGKGKYYIHASFKDRFNIAAGDYAASATITLDCGSSSDQLQN